MPLQQALIYSILESKGEKGKCFYTIERGLEFLFGFPWYQLHTLTWSLSTRVLFQILLIKWDVIFWSHLNSCFSILSPHRGWIAAAKRRIIWEMKEAVDFVRFQFSPHVAEFGQGAVALSEISQKIEEECTMTAKAIPECEMLVMSISKLDVMEDYISEQGTLNPPRYEVE